MTIHLRRLLPRPSSCQPGPPGSSVPAGGIGCRPTPQVPIWHCSRWGLPCRRCCQPRGGLLPHRFTLTSCGAQAVCSLWRFPSGCPGRALPGTVALWSPDFPRGARPPAAIQPSAHVASRRRDGRGQRGSVRRGRPSGPVGGVKRPEAQGRKRRRNAGRTRHASVSLSARRSQTARRIAKILGGPTWRCRPDRQPLQRQPRQSKRGPGSTLRPGAMSEWPITRSGGIAKARHDPRISVSSAPICGSANGCVPVLPARSRSSGSSHR